MHGTSLHDIVVVCVGWMIVRVVVCVRDVGRGHAIWRKAVVCVCVGYGVSVCTCLVLKRRLLLLMEAIHLLIVLLLLVYG